MAERAIIPTVPEDFNAYIHATDDRQLETNPVTTHPRWTDYGWTSGQSSDYSDARTDWDDNIYPLYSNPATSTSIVKKDTHDFINDFIADVREKKLIKKIVASNFATNTDAAIWNVVLERDEEPTPVVAADYAPDIKQQSAGHLISKFRISDPENPDTKAMPKGQKVLLIWFLGATAGVTDPTQLVPGDVELVTRFLKDIKYPAGSTGKWAYVQVCYVTNTGMKGPWSNWLEVLIN